MSDEINFSRKRKVKNKDTEIVMVVIKMTAKEKLDLVKRAEWLTNGNLSALLRESGMNYVPRPKKNIA